jgi:hypothetical protein
MYANMSNVVKDINVQRINNSRVTSNPIRFITLQIPVIDIPGDTIEKKRRKMLQEIDELLDEFSTGPIKNHDALSEMFDVVQVMAGYLLCYTRENVLTGQDAHQYVEEAFQAANDLHLAKIGNYAQERGWHIVRDDE